MLRKLRNDEQGFTLIELLVVILIIGILAAIALPTFLGQQAKGQDSSAKSNARNMVTQVESCFADTQNYGSCTTASALGSTGLDQSSTAVPTTQGQVGVGSSGATSYVVTALSKSGNTFTISKSSGGAPTRGCTVGSGDKGGCNNNTW